MIRALKTLAALSIGSLAICGNAGASQAWDHWTQGSTSCGSPVGPYATLQDAINKQVQTAQTCYGVGNGGYGSYAVYGYQGSGGPPCSAPGWAPNSSSSAQCTVVVNRTNGFGQGNFNISAVCPSGSTPDGSSAGCSGSGGSPACPAAGTPWSGSYPVASLGGNASPTCVPNPGGGSSGCGFQENFGTSYGSGTYTYATQGSLNGENCTLPASHPTGGTNSGTGTQNGGCPAGSGMASVEVGGNSVPACVPLTTSSSPVSTTSSTTTTTGSGTNTTTTTTTNTVTCDGSGACSTVIASGGTTGLNTTTTSGTGAPVPGAGAGAAPGGSSSGGGSSVTPCSPGGADCPVKIDEGGTTAASGHELDTQKTALDTAETSREGALSTVTSSSGKDTTTGLEGSSLPSASCSNYSFAIPHYGTISVGPCAYADQIEAFVSILWYAATMFSCLGMVSGAIRSGA